MKILIFGASFKNNGAQSMIFTTVSEVRRIINDAEIVVMATVGCTPEQKNNLNFEYVAYNPIYDFAMNEKLFRRMTRHVKNIYYTYIKKTFISNREYLHRIKGADLILDISGYALSSQWSEYDCKRYLARIKRAKKYNRQIILLPQSFGPFDFNTNKAEMDKTIKEVLTYPQKIFVREKTGMEYLKPFNLQNLAYSNDLVLTSKELIYDNVFLNKMEVTDPIQGEILGVAIIPNVHTKGENYNVLIDNYVKFVNHLVEIGENVFLIKHSSPDGDICKLIYSHFCDAKNVFLYADDYSCLEFEKMTGHFKFAIASRYHSIVHCYKNVVPCVLVGWAEKYNELANLFSQDFFVIDSRDENALRMLYTVCIRMLGRYKIEKETIRERLNILQKNSCFEELIELKNV